MVISVSTVASRATWAKNVILVNFLSLPLCLTASVLKAHPVVSPAADLKDVHVIKGEHVPG